MPKRFCHDLSAGNIAPFKDKNFPAIFGEIGSSNQAIVSCADDDVIIFFHNDILLQAGYLMSPNAISAAILPGAPNIPPPGCAPEPAR